MLEILHSRSRRGHWSPLIRLSRDGGSSPNQLTSATCSGQLGRSILWKLIDYLVQLDNLERLVDVSFAISKSEGKYCSFPTSALLSVFGLLSFLSGLISVRLLSLYLMARVYGLDPSQPELVPNCHLALAVYTQLVLVFNRFEVVLGCMNLPTNLVNRCLLLFASGLKRCFSLTAPPSVGFLSL